MRSRIMRSNGRHTAPGLALVAVAALLAAGCGGGGGGSVAPPPDPGGKAAVASGEIEGFGSVIVNGVRYDTSAAQFEIDEAAGSQDDLEVGQVVEVEGEIDDSGTSGRADRVVFEAELVATIDFVDTANNAIDAAGQRVIVSGRTIIVDADGSALSLPDLAAGDGIRVSGLLAPDETIRARHIRRLAAAPPETQVRGRIKNLDSANSTFQIRDLVVDYSGANITPPGVELADGRFVKVRGTVAGTNMSATRVRVRTRPPRPDPGGVAELHGIIESVDGEDRFTVNGVVVVHGENTTFRDGSAADIAVGMEVEVKGTVQDDQTVLARLIEFEREDEIELVLKILGNVEGVDSAQRTITIFGQAFPVAERPQARDGRDDTRPFSAFDLQQGDYIAARGSDGEDGPVIFRVERLRPRERNLLQAFVDSADMASNTVVLAGVTVDTSQAEYEQNDQPVTQLQFYTALQAATSLVKARGFWDGQTFLAEKVEIEEPGDEGEDDTPDDTPNGDDS